MNATTTEQAPKLAPSFRPVIEQLSRNFPEFSHPEIIQSVHGALTLLEASSSRMSLYDAASLLLGGKLRGETH